MMKEDTAILVTSPFQTLNAIQAIEEFNIDCPYFFVFGDDYSSEMTKKYISNEGYDYYVVKNTNNAFEALREGCKYKRYKRVIVGDYYSVNFFLMSMNIVAKRGHIIYVDDGNSTLNLLSSYSRRFSYTKIFKKIFYWLLLLYKNLKGVSRSFFTIFDVADRSFPFPIVKNTLSKVQQQVITTPTDIYIIGTNTSQLNIEQGNYVAQLCEIRKYAQNAYQGCRIFYCPHRGDLNHYGTECKELGISIYHTDVSVEVDFATKSIYPKVVIGFGSTALFSLKFLFPDTSVIDLVFHHNDEKLVEEYRQIEQKYREVGINVIEVSDLCNVPLQY